MAAKKKSPPKVIPGHQPYLKGDARWRATVFSWPESSLQRASFRKCVEDYRPIKRNDDVQVAYWAYVSSWIMAHYFLDEGIEVRPAGQRYSEVHPRDDPPKLERQRVGVLHYADSVTKEVYSLGYGEVIGYEVPPVGIWGSVGSPHRVGVQTPRIDLDSGTTIYGCESWWLPEAEMKTFLAGLIRGGYNVNRADIVQYRRDGSRKFEIQGDTGWESLEFGCK